MGRKSRELRQQRRDEDAAVLQRRLLATQQKLASMNMLPNPGPLPTNLPSKSFAPNNGGWGVDGGMVSPGSPDAGGYGNGLPGAVPATGQSPRVNPFMQPKATGLNIISQAFMQNFYVEWNTTTWRFACDQVMKQGQAMSIDTLYTWAFQSSAFIQMLFTKLGDAIDDIEFFVVDKQGNKIDAMTMEFCTKPWHRQLFREILWSYFWGFSMLNFDPLSGKVYKYPMRQIDPLSKMVKGSTYDYFDGMLASDYANLIFIQPHTNEESFLGYMQPITKAFIMMNQSKNNWVSAGRRLAFPVMTVGYPQNASALDPLGANQLNPFKLQAEEIAAEVDPSKGFVYPYTLNGKGDIQKSIEIDFAETKAGQNMYKIYSEFSDDEKNEIRELILGGTLSSTGSKSGSGSRSLGEVHERMFKQVVKSKIEFVLSVLNTDFKPKIEQFYSSLPTGWRYEINRSSQLTFEEMTSLSQVMSQNGKRLTDSFFEENGLNPDFFEDAPEPVAPMGKNGKPAPDPDPDVNMARRKKKFW